MSAINPAPQAGNASHEYHEQEKNADAAVVTVNSDSSDTKSMESHHAEWKPSFWGQFPWTGIGALVVILLCSASAVGVIYASNQKAKSEWKVKATPNVLLSVFTSLSSILVTMAVGQGIAIAWWRKALKGATVEDLHNSWSFGSSIMAIVTKYKFFNIMALTALCTKFAIVDSTLFQKALSTRTALGPVKATTLPVFPLEAFPPTGTLNQFGNATADMKFQMTNDEILWIQSPSGLTSTNGFGGCEGVCGMTYRGIGFASSCTFTNVSSSRSQSAVEGGDNLLLSATFTQAFATPEKNYDHIVFNWASWVPSYDGQCGGQLENLTCELRPAVLDYPITISNTSFSYRKTKEKGNNYLISIAPLNETGGYADYWSLMDDVTTDPQIPEVKFVQYLDTQEPQTPSGNSSIGGILYALSTYYQTKATVSYTTERVGDTNVSAPATSSDGLFITYTQNSDNNDGCPIGYNSPLYDGTSIWYYEQLLMSINYLTLLVSDDFIIRSNYTGTNDFTSDEYSNYWYANAIYTDAKQLKDETYFVSNMAFAWAAFASTIVVVVLILPSYWGFWQLGRKVSLGPLEIANAFEAPAFGHVNVGNGHVEGVLKAVGKEKVQYGGYSHDQHGVKYGFRQHSAA